MDCRGIMLRRVSGVRVVNVVLLEYLGVASMCDAVNAIPSAAEVWLSVALGVACLAGMWLCLFERVRCSTASFGIFGAFSLFAARSLVHESPGGVALFAAVALVSLGVGSAQHARERGYRARPLGGGRVRQGRDLGAEDGS